MSHRFSYSLSLALLVLSPPDVSADVKLPAILGSKMVLQREKAVPIWGWADPGERVTVTINGQSQQAAADKEGRWQVRLDPMKAATGLELVVRANNELRLANVAVGEVWVCSGQSNMQMTVNRSRDADLEKAAANYPGIRLVRVNTQGSQEPQHTFDGQWEACSPETIGKYTAVGYFYGRQIHRTLGVPVGLIDNAWGGSACESWVRRDLLVNKPLYTDLMQRWEKTEAEFDWEKLMKDYEIRLATWKEEAATARKQGRSAPPRPRTPRNALTGQHRPANLFNARILTVAPMGIRGAIWYQGEANASRAFQYRQLFPLMIQNWRDVWGQGEFPFYFVQLADFKAEQSEPSESEWAELREAQTMTLSHSKRTGQAVIIDLGEGADIHPRNKQDVALRLARWALANDYGIDIPFRSPELSSATFAGKEANVELDHVVDGIKPFDTREIRGFTVAGKDRIFRHAQAKIVGKNRVVVWHDSIDQPVAVRYAWADNPVCNLKTLSGLPVTPFRSDDWPGLTADVR